MAKRPSVQEILELARKGGPAKPEADEATSVEAAAEPENETSPAADLSGVAPEVEAIASPPVPANLPSPATLGRPLTLQEKLAAARAGGSPKPAVSAPASKPAKAAPAPVASEVEAEAPKPAPAVPATAQPLGRPLSLKEKLAAARSGGATASASAPAGAKPAGGAAPPSKPAAAVPARVLPSLDKMTDPRDLAEALRQTGARKTKESAAKAVPAAPSKPAAKAAPAKPATVLPKPGKQVAEASRAAAVADRRGFMIGSLFVSWIVVAWTSFTAGVVAFTGMLGRFMFPNVLAEPPSTIKVGLPGNYEPEEVSERFKGEWGFWIVRSKRYNGQDIIYALQTVCTHLGCPPNWLANEQKFKCPCHGSGFYVSGINFEGPAPRPLERFKLTLADDGQILVDKSQKFQQELGQWSDPDSYIAV